MSKEIESFVCPKCGGELQFSHKDDLKQQWYRCQACKLETTKPKKKAVSPASTKKPKPPKREDQCQACAWYMTPKCDYLDDFKKGTMTGTDEKCVDFYSKREPKEGKRESQADKLIKLCLAHNPTLFQDQHRTAYVTVEQSNIHVNLKVRSKTFKAWLAGLLWQHEEKAPSTEALYGAINVLEAKAFFEGEKHELYNRVAPAEDGFWIDITDDKWRAIKVTGEGWKIVEDSPILFKRFSHQLPLVTPVPGGDPWRFLDFINVKKEDKATRLTLLCAIISYLIPNIPHPIIVAYGIQGSAKTWLFKLIRKVIDPSIICVLTLPRNERERVQQLAHHWCAFYDNVTALKPWMSDTLCRAATGGGFSKRELYTDDSDVTYSFRRCVGINGINIAAQRGDLLDRSLLINLQNIPKTRRITESKLLREFERCKGEILGGFLDALVKAIQLYPSVKPKGLFRMADFTRWGCAIAMALGSTQQDFMDAYETKVKIQIEEAALASPVATVLIDLMESIEKWDGTPSQLYKALLNNAKELGIGHRQKAWPKAPNSLVRQLNELTPSLEALGWEVVTGVRTGPKGTRRVLINSVRTVRTVSTMLKTHENNGKTTDDITRQVSSVKSLENNVKNPLTDDIDGTDASLQSSSREIMVSIKSWCLANRNERSEINLHALATFIEQELKQNSQRVIQIAFNQAILMPSSKPGKAVVV